MEWGAGQVLCQVLSEGERLGDEPREWMATGRLAERLQPLR